MMEKEESNKILVLGLDIEEKLMEKNIYNFSMKAVLRKVINTQSGSKMISLIKANITNDDYFHFILDTLKHEESHPFRERLSREDLSVFMNNCLKIANENSEIESYEARKKVYRWTLFIRVLRRKIPNWLVLDEGLITFYKKRLF